MATIKDVARVANVSVATVSRVINNRGYLSADVRARVADAMKKLGYQPNDIARSLLRQESHIFGLIVPSLAHPFFGEVARALEYYAYQAGYKLMVCNSLQNREKEREYIDMLKRSQVDGIVMGSHLLATSDYEDLTLPLVSLDRKLGDTIPYICCDNYQGGLAATRHLLELGCKNLVHICGSLEVNMLSNKRTDAFMDVCAAAGVASRVYELSDAAVTDFGEEEALSVILNENPDCDGMFITSDVSAALMIGLAARASRRVPEELKIIGFDGNLVSSLTSPKLTTVVQPVDLICRYVIEYLVNMAKKQTVPSQTILPVVLRKCASTLGAAAEGGA